MESDHTSVICQFLCKLALLNFFFRRKCLIESTYTETDTLRKCNQIILTDALTDSLTNAMNIMDVKLNLDFQTSF